MTQGRDLLIERLRADLIGPGESDELLSDRPGDRYLTGILSPPETALDEEEDEQLGTSGAGGDEEEDDDASVPLANTRRPNACGFSFSVTGRPAVVTFGVRCGSYQPVAATSEDKADGRRRPYWQRTDHRFDVDLEIDRRLKEIDLSENGTPGLGLYVVAQRSGERWDVTAILQNQNPPGDSRAQSEERTFFQVELRAVAKNGSEIVPRPSVREATIDDDDRAARLIYRDAHEFACGHTSAAAWDTRGDRVQVRTTWIPEVTVQGVSPDGGEAFDDIRSHATLSPLSAQWLTTAEPDQVLAGLSLLPDAYERWLSQEERKVDGISEDLRPQARAHLARGRHAAIRMQGAIERLRTDDSILSAFLLAQQAMVLQRRWSRRENDLIWRPFQLGFQLLCLESIVDDQHHDREVMDLLWFPTGGGKTEAYLALVALTLFSRRLRSPDATKAGGVGVLMRYTLRLLTIQQFQRAAALVMACEFLRRNHASAALKGTPFGIGLWVGGSTTPNTVEEARTGAAEGTSDCTHKQLRRCPCCNQELDWEFRRRPDAVAAVCRNATCELAMSNPHLPIWTVDEDLYRERPSLVIATVDKFAQLARKREPGNFFGLDKENAPPTLIIQDELHLIAGPLGTITALYEVAVDELCAHAGSRPKVIGSTATIRRAEAQVHALFNRSTFQFPPPILDANNSGFAVVDPALPGRRYVAVTTAGRSPKFTLQAATASLLQAAASAEMPSYERDWYWTLVEYFNALRELGGALVLMHDDVAQTLREISVRRNETQRQISVLEELTSRRSASEIPDILDLLETKHAGDPAACDVLLATNMISVGVDVTRFGLMVVNGQPKGMAEYIQATSRVGRGNVPGLVVSVLNHNRVRDRSHFESFATWHSTLYREVEATSATPFASRAQDRALHAVLCILAMHLVPSMAGKPRLDAARRAEVEIVGDAIIRRVRSIDPDEVHRAEHRLRVLIDEWSQRGGLDYWWNDYDEPKSLLVSAEEKAAQRAADRVKSRAWGTLNSMRGVEASVQYRLVEGLRLTKRRNDAEE